MSDRDRSSPSLTDTPLKTYIGRHDDDYPLINGNGEWSPRARRALALGAHHALGSAAGHWVTAPAPAFRLQLNLTLILQRRFILPHCIRRGFDRPAELVPEVKGIRCNRCVAEILVLVYINSNRISIEGRARRGRVNGPLMVLMINEAAETKRVGAVVRSVRSPAAADRYPVTLGFRVA